MSGLLAEGHGKRIQLFFCAAAGQELLSHPVCRCLTYSHLIALCNVAERCFRDLWVVPSPPLLVCQPLRRRCEIQVQLLLHCSLAFVSSVSAAKDVPLMRLPNPSIESFVRGLIMSISGRWWGTIESAPMIVISEMGDPELVT